MQRGRRKPIVKAEPVAHSHSIQAAFAKQLQGKICTICKIRFSLAEYRRHFDSCTISVNDTECQVTVVITAEEKKKLASEVVDICNDESFNNTIPNTPMQSQELEPENLNSQVSSQSSGRRRSARLQLLDQAASQKNKSEKENLPISTVLKKRKASAERIMAQPELELTVTQNNSGDIKKRLIKEEKSESSSPPAKKIVKLEKITVANLLDKISLIRKSEGALKVEAIDSDVDEDNLVMRNTPYFVKFTLEAIHTVLSLTLSDGRKYDESFWKEDMRNLDNFLNLSCEARKVLLRLFLRKRQWLTIERLKQRYSEVEDRLPKIFKELEAVSFVENSEDRLNDLELALKLLPLPNIKNVARLFQLDTTKLKADIANSLLEFSNRQQGLFGQKGVVKKRMLKAVKTELGPCFRISSDITTLLKSFLTLFSPTETNSALAIDNPNTNIEQTMLFTMLQVEIGKLSLPAPNPCNNIISIYETKEELVQYIEAKEMEIEVMSLIANSKHEKALEICMKARELLSEEFFLCSIQKSSWVMPSLRRFTASWVLVRCVSHGAGLWERKKNYPVAVEWQRFLLKSETLLDFCMDSRGNWWDRLALNLDSHLKEKDEALEELKEGLLDKNVREKDQLLLQDRAKRLLKSFEPILILDEPKTVTIKGNVLNKNIGDSRVNRFIRSENGTVIECSVEEIVRIHYLQNEDYKNGVHAEGSIWHTVLGLLFYDILFDHNLPERWLSRLQSHPIDLNCSGMYESRKTAFNERFSWLEHCNDAEIQELVCLRWVAYNGVQTSEINWDLFPSPSDCSDFITSCPRQGLVNVLRRIVTDYRATRSGFPDLTFWNDETRQVAVVEVKGPGDRLSTKQRLWLHYFSKWGFRAEVCHVVAKNNKQIA